MKIWTQTKKPGKNRNFEHVFGELQSPECGGWYLKKRIFLKYLLAEQHKKSRKNLAESFDFSTIFKKIRNEKAQRSTILEGGVHSCPPPHLVVKEGLQNATMIGIKKHQTFSFWFYHFPKYACLHCYVYRAKFSEYSEFVVGSAKFRRNVPVPSRYRSEGNLTICAFQACHLSRGVWPICGQIWVSTVRIWWWIRISVRSGRTGPVPWVTGPGRFNQNGHLARDSGELRQIWPQIRNLRKKLGHIGLVRVGPDFCGSSYGSVWDFGPGRTGPRVRNSGPGP